MTRVDVSPLAWLDEVERQRRAAGLRRSLRARPPVGAELDLASNDYLGLSQHPDVIDGGVAALRTWGAGSSGSRLVTGNTELHEDFEAALADFVGAESALVFSSGYTANLGAVVALSGPGSLLVSDALTHASLVDACRLSRARVAVTPHRDVAAVETALSSRDEDRAVVITDSVFSADGDLAPLRRLHDVCRRHGALLIVDEAHGLGVRGTGGRGLLDEVGLAGAPDVVMTMTMSKALGSQGGAVLGPAAVRDHLIDAARPFIFDTGLAPAAVGAAWAALRVLIAEPWRPQAVLGFAAELAERVRRSGPAGIGGGVGDSRCTGGGARRRDRVPRPRGAGGLLPSADGACGHVAAAADGTGVAVRGRDDAGAHGAHGSVVDGPAVSVLVVTGTDTGVGKTVATAALACHARLAGIDVAVCKPVQTGSRRRRRRPRRDRAAVRCHRTARSGTASRAAWRPRRPRRGRECRLPTRDELASMADTADRPGRLTLVEGAGGLLVEIGDGGVTLRDLAARSRRAGARRRPSRAWVR